ncbi:MAG: ATP-binding protein [Casimicrobiaceae bacterium]
MTLTGPGSMTHAVTRSLLVGLALIWLLGVLGSGVVLKRLVDENSDDELRESAVGLMSLLEYTDDLLLTAAVLGERPERSGRAAGHDRLYYQIRDASGRMLLRSGNANAGPLDVPLKEGFADVGDWRVVTVVDPYRKRFLQVADPQSERRNAVMTALVWLMLPLAALLAFATYIVYRASRSLTRQVEQTALALARQDPQALGLLPLDGLVTEMRPAVEATNQLLARLAAALEAERSFTYNSAHELRTPIAAAMAQGQLLAARVEGTPLHTQAQALVGALSRLARLAERLLALARAEGAQPLADQWVDLATVVRLTVGEFQRDPRLRGRRLTGEVAPARVRADLDAVGLALRNMVENAIVHGAGGSFIRIVCTTARDASTLAVIDDGPGVGDGEVSALVKRFARGPGAASGGAGLGLSIVDSLARRMAATLVLKSPPEGTTRGFEARLVWRSAAA